MDDLIKVVGEFNKKTQSFYNNVENRKRYPYFIDLINLTSTIIKIVNKFNVREKTSLIDNPLSKKCQ